LIPGRRVYSSATNREHVKVALLVPNLQLGGAERNIVVLGEALREDGVEVEIWLTSSSQLEISTTLGVVTPTHSGRLLRGYSIPWRVADIRRNIARFRPDCMVSFLESSNIPAILAGLGARLPTLVSVRGNPKRFNWFYRLMVFFLYRFASSVITPSREVAEVLARAYRLRNTTCIPNIQPASSPLETSLTDKMSGPIVAVGRLVPGKKFSDVIAFVENLALDRELLIVGDGPERGSLQQIASRSRVRVRFTGSLAHDEVMGILKRASALLSMSVSECWPNSICEALTSGTPVIARDCNYGPREMIVDRENGFLIRSVDDAARRIEIRSALLSVPLYESLCTRARESTMRWTKERIKSLWMTQLSRSLT
jgi:GalNAc-alpha-(1->4)-GalNAc-alpha-(1->3)-diNAcBac-PP-undecaprenol alpha-1,4-N-acetyl-D-galactosaminyltransferase